MKLKKILTMKTRPEISDQEIQSMMDFDKVLDVHRSARKRNRILFSAGVTGGTIILLLTIWKFTGTPEPVVQEPIVAPTEKKSETVKESPENTTPSTSTEPAASPVTTPTPAKPEKAEEEAEENTKPVVESTQSYTEAEPVNGYPDLYAYFQKELKYPDEAVKDSIEGIVSVSFVINKDGRPEQVKILNSLGKAFDDEAVRVITNMPQWKSASMNGKAVPAKISMPLTFQINRAQKQIEQ